MKQIRGGAMNLKHLGRFFRGYVIKDLTWQATLDSLQLSSFETNWVSLL